MMPWFTQKLLRVEMKKMMEERHMTEITKSREWSDWIVGGCEQGALATLIAGWNQNGWEENHVSSWLTFPVYARE